MPSYIPIDLAFEHYAHVKQELNALEYAKILAEISKPRYSVVTEAEGYDLFMQDKLDIPDKVRVIWLHDVERPNDNALALSMAEMEHEFGLRSSFNLRVVCVLDPEWREYLDKIDKLGHDFEYQHEDIVITQGDKVAGLESFKKHLAYLRSFYPRVRLAFGHGVYKSGFPSDDLFKRDGKFCDEVLAEAGLPPYGELYYFLEKLAEKYGSKYHYFGESRCLGGDEFADALRSCKEGDVVFFLQHPTWWSSHYDLDELKKIVRTSVFFN